MQTNTSTRSRCIKSLLYLLLLPILLLQGFATPHAPKARALSAPKQVTKSHAVIHEALPGVKLELHNDTIVSVALSPSSSQVNHREWYSLIGSKYVLGDVHQSDVTPQLWRKLEVRMQKHDGSIADITMLRPLWWLKQVGAKEGGNIGLTVPEAGFSGKATILTISPCQVDSRQRPAGTQTVISTIKHQNAQVLRLFVSGQKKSIGVTPNHPIFSLSRNTWVPAGKLRIGEKLKTKTGVVVVKRLQKGGKKEVYNLEVHQARTYFVGKTSILVHNSGVKCSDDVDDVFEWSHPKHPDLNFVEDAQVRDGLFSLSIEASKENRGIDGFKRGGELFEMAWNRFAGKVDIKGIRGNWLYGDNLQRMNEAILKGIPAENAALHNTFTGAMAKKKGFTNVKMIGTPRQNNTYEQVSVIFTKP